MDVAAQVVEFWKEAGPAKWFARDDAFDAQFRQLFWMSISPPLRARANIGWAVPKGRWP